MRTRDHPRFFDQVGHQITYASIGNKYSRVWNRRRAGNNRRAWKICQKE